MLLGWLVSGLLGAAWLEGVGSSVRAEEQALGHGVDGPCVTAKGRWRACVQRLVDEDERAGGLCRDSELLCCLREVRGSSMKNEDVGDVGG